MTKQHEIWKLCLVGLLASVAICGPVVWEPLAGHPEQISDLASPIAE